ncbi:MAG: hypothetical protein RBR08_15565 [Desulforegulaceae bacterium]|nr:hypothetical protein [Desulforegulaceae bacterium]
MQLNKPKKCFAFFSIFIIIVLVYINSFNASWHFDDFHNIIDNPWVTVKDLYPETILNTFKASYDGGEYAQKKIYRPIPMISFAVNWYYSGKNTTLYHITNTAIHIISSFFLFLTIFYLFQTPNIKNRYSVLTAYHTALFAAILWAVHPIQTQAVTYIVQRMASMSGMFYIGGILFYLLSRLSKEKPKNLINFFICFLMFFFAICSKENAAIFPATLILVEIIFFQKKKFFIKNKLIVGYFFIFLILSCFFVFFVINVDFFSLLKGYQSRPFTLFERILTETRILCFYLYQLFYPVSSVFSITHSIEISKNLISPFSTLTSILFILSVICFSLVYYSKFPFLSFGVLFFFLNHVIESSFIPLELIFEHRNYIPSMFIFLPVCLLFIKSLSKYDDQIFKQYFFSLGIPLVLIIVGFGTYVRNFDWISEKSLWSDALQKAPENARPYHNLSGTFLNTDEEYKFFELNNKARSLFKDRLYDAEMISYLNISRYYERRNEYDKAVQYSKKAYEKFNSKKTFLAYLNSLLSNNDIREVTNILSLNSKKIKGNEILNIETIAYLKTQEYDKAYNAALKAYKLDPLKNENIIYFGYANYALGKKDVAKFYFQRVLEDNIHTYDKIFIYFLLIQISTENNDELFLEKIITKFVKNTNFYVITQFLNIYKNQKFPVVHIDIESIFDKLIKSYKEKIFFKEKNIENCDIK